MSESGPSILAQALWAKNEAKFLAILTRALIRLRGVSRLAEQEVDLNRELFWCLLFASRDLYPQEELAPISECNNQPDPDDVERSKREQKRPDFQWIYLDRYESDTRRSSKQFVVECKRLGSPRAKWILNRNYIEHGVIRFVDPAWGYAQRFPSGAMVAYWQDMDSGAVLAEVNAAGDIHKLRPLLLGESGWVVGGVSTLRHDLERPFPISPFSLVHLWIDIRGKCQPTGSSN